MAADGAVYTFGFGAPPCSLGGDHTRLSLSAGGTQELRLDAGVGLANRPYLVLVSASGTQPGFPVGTVVLPLAVDLYTAYALTFFPPEYRGRRLSTAPWPQLPRPPALGGGVAKPRIRS